jgi:regulator of protease activity HflC (stomatin/prohibitin superfamily)
MNRKETAAVVSAVACSLMTLLLLATILVYAPFHTARPTDWYAWPFHALTWLAMLMSLTGVATSVSVAWTLGQNRREAAARAAAAVGVRTAGNWGADVQERVLAEEVERLALVRRSVERKLSVAVGVVLAAAAGFGVFTLATGNILIDRDGLEEGVFKKKREMPDPAGFPGLGERTRFDAVLLLGLAVAGLGLSALTGQVSREPGASPLAAEAGFHRIRGFAFLLAACVLFGDSLDPESYYRNFRWLLLVPPAALFWLTGGNRYAALALPALGLLDDMVLASIAGAEPGSAEWWPAVSWAMTAVLAWQAIETLWHAFQYRPGPAGFVPVSTEQGLVAFTEGRGLAWALDSMSDNFGAEIDHRAARHFLTEYVGATMMAVAFLFYLTTCVGFVRPWERGLRERFGLLVEDVVPVLLAADGQTAGTDVVVEEADGQTTYTFTDIRGRRRTLPARQVERRGVKLEYVSRPEVLSPGWHLKFPWPVERIVTMPTEGVDDMTFGSAGHDHSTGVVLWDMDHYDNEFEMLTGDKSLASVVARMHWRVRDPVRFFKTVFPETAADRKHTDEHAGDKDAEQAAGVYNEQFRRRRGARHGPHALLAQVGYRSLTETVSANSIWALMAEQRGALEEEIRRNVQSHLDRLDTGLEVMRVCLTDVHPPVKEGTAREFELVLQAMERREDAINTARADVNQMLPEAKAAAQDRIAEAASEAFARVRAAGSEVAAHKALAAVRDSQSPGRQGITVGRLLGEARLRMLGDRRLVVLPPEGRFQVRLGDEPDLLDVVPPAPDSRPAAPR